MTRSKTARRRQAHQPRPLRRIPPQADFFVGKLNVYQCERGHPTVTVDLDAGGTPAGMPCPHTSARGFPVVTVECGLHARSCWYRVPQDLVPTHEWYRPGDGERRTLDVHQAHHVDLGGLLIRRIEPRVEAP